MAGVSESAVSAPWPENAICIVTPQLGCGDGQEKRHWRQTTPRVPNFCGLTQQEREKFGIHASGLRRKFGSRSRSVLLLVTSSRGRAGAYEQ